MHSTVKWIFLICNLTEDLYKLAYKNMVMERERGKGYQKVIVELSEGKRRLE